MTLTDIAVVPHAVWLAVGALLGLVFGSFVTALSYRLPRGQDFVNARSKCPACSTTLAARDLVPILSWAFNRARCRVCAAPVSVRYPLTELLMAAIFVSAVMHETRLIELGLLLVAAVLMMTLAIIDLETKRLPLSLLALLAVVCGVMRWFGPGDLQNGLIVAGVIALLGLVTATATRARLGAPLIGAGDSYALAAAGLVLPWEVFAVFLGVAGVFALVLGLLWRALRGEPMFPFAPALFAALWLALLYGDLMLGFMTERLA